MSWDYTVYVKVPKVTRSTVLALGRKFVDGVIERDEFGDDDTLEGLLEERALSPGVPALLTEEGRLAFPGRRLLCTIFEGALKVKSYTYELDGYGRAVSVRVGR